MTAQHMSEDGQGRIRHSAGRHRAGVAARLQRPRALLATVSLLFAGFAGSVVASAGAAQAGSTSLSTFTKTGIDLTNGSTAAVGQNGNAQPGDTVKWVLSYGNNTGKTAALGINDAITGGQLYKAGTLHTPPNITGTESNNTVTANGTVLPGTTAAQSSPFQTSTTDFSQDGGDGWSVEGLRGNIYTVFHHQGFNSTYLVFCATLTNQTCPGWTVAGHAVYASYVTGPSGTPMGAGPLPGPDTSGLAGSFIAGEKLYWPVQATSRNNSGAYSEGIQCLDLTTETSCGYTELGTITTEEDYGAGNEGAGLLNGDGIPVDGKYYYADANGIVYCFNPANGACGSANVGGGNGTDPVGAGFGVEPLTVGHYVYLTWSSTNPFSSDSNFHMSCYDTTTNAKCNNAFPVSTGTFSPIGYYDLPVPVVDSSGSVLGACGSTSRACFKPSGASFADPYPAGETFGSGIFPLVAGFGQGVLVGTKYYIGSHTNSKVISGRDRNEPVECFDFGSWSGTGAVPSCSGYTPPSDVDNYTVRSLDNLPGCGAADGDTGQVAVFSLATGAPCTTATQSLSLTPDNYYCDGKSGHTTTWGTVSLTGLSSSDYAGATLSLSDKNGTPVPGYRDLSFPASGTIDISGISTQGTTSSLTATVDLSAVSNTSAVQAAQVQMSWKGDPIQVCYETTLPQVACAQSMPVSNDANAVTTAGTLTDAPSGNDSGTVTFDVAPTSAQCPADISVTKSVNPASGTSVSPGQVLTYTLTFANSGQGAGTVDYTDDLAGVLDDASLTGGPAASNPALTVSAVNPSTNSFEVTGTVPANTTYTVTYTVTVKAYASEANHSVDNFLEPTGTAPPSTCISTNPLCTHNPVTAPGHAVNGHGTDGKTSSPAGLAFTGGDWLAYVLLGGLLLGTGALLVVLVRRPRGTA